MSMPTADQFSNQAGHRGKKQPQREERHHENINPNWPQKA
jgi:hypothetical protein